MQKNQVAYKAWLDSIPPEKIRQANLARDAMKRMGLRGTRNHLPDPRKVKRLTIASTHFLKERHASGDFKGVPVQEATPLILKEWRDLSPAAQRVSIQA